MSEIDMGKKAIPTKVTQQQQARIPVTSFSSGPRVDMTPKDNVPTSSFGMDMPTPYGPPYGITDEG